MCENRCGGSLQVVFSRELLPSQQASLENLVFCCRQKDGITLSCPLDGDLYWLICREEAVVACLAAYEMEENAWECCAFTHPDLRNRGYFSALLEAACGEDGLLSDADLYFLTDGRCAQALSVLEHIGAEHGYDELMMERELEEIFFEGKLEVRVSGDTGTVAPGGNGDVVPPGGNGDAVPPAVNENLGAVPPAGNRDVVPPAAGPAKGPDTNNPEASTHTLTATAALCGSIVGSCHLQPTNATDNGIYLYGLEIIPEKRGRGLGTEFLKALFPLLREMGFHRLSLQVSGHNTAALALYKKTGFRITQTLSYFLY